MKHGLHRRHLLSGAFAASALAAWSQPAMARVTPILVMPHLLRLSHDDGREVQYRMMIPIGLPSGPRPVILFSHGANSRSTLYDALLAPLCRAGFVIIAPDHADAGGAPSAQDMPAQGLWLSRIDDLKLPLERTADFQAVADTIGTVLDFDRVCAAGHSLGAAVAQSLAGARLHRTPETAPDSQGLTAVSALIALSPPGPRAGLVPQDAWSTVIAPTVLVTGTADILPGFIDTWETHITGFSDHTDGQRWQVVGDGVDHYFGGLICRLSDGPRAEQQRPALNATADMLVDFLKQWAATGAVGAPTSEVAPMLEFSRF